MTSNPVATGRPLARIRNYEVVRRLAKGGMAEIFLAWQTGAGGFRRQVVLKRIHPHISSDPLFIKMFLNEAQIAAGLSHPNIVHIYEFFADPPNGSYIIAMEYLDGENVQNILREAAASNLQIPIGLVIRVMTAVCEALDYAYSEAGPDGQPRHIVHRDASPSNVLVGMDGQVKLLDFGIAKALESDALTKVGTLKGKYSYMSPEQVRSLPIDHRSDIFSVGIMLWEMTTGRRLFKRPTAAATLAAVLTDPIPPPSSVVPDYPSGLEPIVMRALDREPSARYVAARDLAADLEELAQRNQWVTTATALAAFMRQLFAAKRAAADLSGRDVDLPFFGGPEASSTMSTPLVTITSKGDWVPDPDGPEEVAPEIELVPSAEPVLQDDSSYRFAMWLFVAFVVLSAIFWVLLFPRLR